MRAPIFLLLSAGRPLCLTTAGPARAQAEAAFAKANADYAAGHFPQAVKDTSRWSTGGNGARVSFTIWEMRYFRMGDFGHAILNYQRALALAPTQPEAQANLRLARDQARALELAPSWAEEHLGFSSLDQYAVARGGRVLGCGVRVRVLYFRPPPRGGLDFRSGSIVRSWRRRSVCVYAVFENGRSGRDLAIVTGKKIQARLATAESAGTVLVLPPGSEIKILSTRGDWSYAALPNDLRGWIPAQSAERVRL